VIGKRLVIVIRSLAVQGCVGLCMAVFGLCTGDLSYLSMIDWSVVVFG